MMALGEDGYMDKARELMEITTRLKEGVQKIDVRGFLRVVCVCVCVCVCVFGGWGCQLL